jgi:superfamily II DNA helicase RecQ
VWLPGRPLRARLAAEPGARSTPRATPTRFAAGGLRHTDLSRELDNFRRRAARSLKWKPYMVFQRRVIQAIDERRPQTRDQLARIPGLGPAKLERFGDDILALVRRHDG